MLKLSNGIFACHFLQKGFSFNRNFLGEFQDFPASFKGQALLAFCPARGPLAAYALVYAPKSAQHCFCACFFAAPDGLEYI
jgi:hypothetical protein